eukprot:2915601-Pyramimonas_sp.AAC.2
MHTPCNMPQRIAIGIPAYERSVSLCRPLGSLPSPPYTPRLALAFELRYNLAAGLARVARR